MKTKSAKRRRRESEARPFRNALKESVGRCEHCMKPKAPEYLDVDEIARGSSRQKAIDQPYAVLVVCRSCHGIIQGWSRAKRLALLYLARTSAFDLEAYYKLTGRRWPELSEVMREVNDILENQT